MPRYLEPLDERVVIRRATIEEKTAAGIILPESSRKDEERDQGEVIAIGCGYPVEGTFTAFRPLTVKVGDRVIFSRYAGGETMLDGVTYMIVSERDIYAIIHQMEDP